MRTTVFQRGKAVTLLTSYCGDDKEGCTDRHPCEVCISMCNTYKLIDDVPAIYTGQVGERQKVSYE